MTRKHSIQRWLNNDHSAHQRRKKKPRILLYCINYAPELTGISKYTTEMAEWLADNGMDVSVVTAPPYYPAWRIDPLYSGVRYQRERIGEVTVFRCPLWVPRQVTGLKRIVHLASFALSSLPVILWLSVRLRPKLILVVEPPLLAAPAAWMAARLSGAAAWLHVQDFEVDAAFDMGILRARGFRRLVLAIESWLMRRFDQVSTISQHMIKRLASKGVQVERTRFFPNWVKLDRIFPLLHTTSLRTKNFRDDQIIVLYSGNFGKKQGLEILVEAVRILDDQQNDRIHFLLCGDGVASQRLQESATGLRNITFWPLVPMDLLNDLLNLADIHVLPQRADTEDLVFPSKLTNMLASGRPVVATANPRTQIAEILDDCGLVVPPGDAAALASALKTLANDKEQRILLGAAARRIAESLWDKNKVLTSMFGEPIDSTDNVVAPSKADTTTEVVRSQSGAS